MSITILHHYITIITDSSSYIYHTSTVSLYTNILYSIEHGRQTVWLGNSEGVEPFPFVIV